MEKTKAIRCVLCAHFIPDQIGDGAGIGQCKKYNDYRAKKPSKKALKRAYEQLGGRLFWGGSGGRNRICAKFEGV